MSPTPSHEVGRGRSQTRFLLPLSAVLAGVVVGLLSWEGGVNPFLAAVAGLGAVPVAVGCLIALVDLLDGS